MISELRKMEFKDFIQDYKILESKDKLWLLSLLHNSSKLDFFRIINNENIPVGIGSLSCGEQKNEVSFAIFKSQRKKGYGSYFLGYIQSAFPGACFKVSHLNLQCLSLFTKNQPRLKLTSSYHDSIYTFFT